MVSYVVAFLFMYKILDSKFSVINGMSLIFYLLNRTNVFSISVSDCRWLIFQRRL